MTLEKCPFCKSTDIGYNCRFGGYAVCSDCGMDGPENDPDGEKWNAVSRAVHGSPTIESTESGPMPWRLQIAAQLWAPALSDFMPQEMIEAADSLIAAHKATEVK